MEGTEVTVTERDLSEVLRVKVNEVTNLQIQLAALTRTMGEKVALIAELEAKNNKNGSTGSDYETGSSK